MRERRTSWTTTNWTVSANASPRTRPTSLVDDGFPDTRLGTGRKHRRVARCPADAVQTPAGLEGTPAATGRPPPTCSGTTSTGSAMPSSPITTSLAPSALSPAPRCAESTDAMTWAPPSRASCIASRPAPPAAPVIRTRRPSTEPAARNVRRAVRPARAMRQPRRDRDLPGRRRCCRCRTQLVGPDPQP